MINTSDRNSTIISIADGRINPDLVRRTGGGWLAIAPKGCPFSIGVDAPTPEGARAKFSSVIHRWLEILASGQKAVST